jgi:hypothetical protein
MAGKNASGKKSSGQLGELEVKARNKKRAERQLKKAERRKALLIKRYQADNKNVSNDELNRLIHWKIAPRKPSRPKPALSNKSNSEQVVANTIGENQNGQSKST